MIREKFGRLIKEIADNSAKIFCICIMMPLTFSFAKVLIAMSLVPSWSLSLIPWLRRQFLRLYCSRSSMLFPSLEWSLSRRSCSSFRALSLVDVRSLLSWDALCRSVETVSLILAEVDISWRFHQWALVTIGGALRWCSQWILKLHPWSRRWWWADQECPPLVRGDMRVSSRCCQAHHSRLHCGCPWWLVWQI